MVDMKKIIEKIKNFSFLIEDRANRLIRRKGSTVEEFRNGTDNELFFNLAILLLMLCIYKNKK